MPTHRTDRFFALFFLLGVAAATLLIFELKPARDSSREGAVSTSYPPPEIAPRSPEAEAATRGLVLKPGFEATLFAAEPDIANPVAFAFAPGGGVYVCETFRQEEKGVPDNRDHEEWLLDDLAARSTSDRRRFYLRHHPEMAHTYTQYEDRIRFLEDRNGDGRADFQSVFAGGFRDLLDGTGAGVLSWRGRVYYTCIPKLWSLRDVDGDHVADEREVLFDGFGIHVALRGHDLHGLTLGPDGRIYFSIGDRGFNVVTREGRRLLNTQSGAVLRCEPDGTALEIVATGLRNPQELAFDDVGDLFTVDNNSDAGDRARIVRIVQGGESGWRMDFQSQEDRGPWMREGWWKTRTKDQAAFLIPPIAYLGSGPSGLVHYPGTGFPSECDDSFFVCNFLGGRRSSGILRFRLEPHGADHQLKEEESFVSNLLPTDVDFGPDGALWISDWVSGWVGKGKGRLYRVWEPSSSATPEAVSARALLAGRFEDLEVDRLASLLSHPDQRVRLRAQHALVFRPNEGEPVFREIVWSESLPPQARLHAIWGLGILHRRMGTSLDDLIPLLGDRDDEVRGQIAKLLGEARVAEARPVLEELLADESSRVRYFAAQALGKVGTRRSLSALAALLRENADRDVILRHGAVMALVGIAGREAQALDGMAAHPNPSVRLAVLLALAKRKDPRVARFLTDDLALARESARAVFDRRISAAYPDLARWIDPPISDEVILRRAIAAAEALGGKERGSALVNLAVDARRVRSELRVLALEAIRRWDAPSVRDPVLGSYRPRDPWPRSEVASLLTPELRRLLTATSDDLVKAALAILVHWKIHDHDAVLLGLVASEDRTLAVRRAALRALADLDAPELEEAARLALGAKAPKLRADAAGAMAKLAPRTAMPLIRAALAKGSVPEKQAAMSALRTLRGPEADALVLDLGRRLLRGNAPEAYRLEISRVLTSRSDPSAEIRSVRTSWERARAALKDPVDRRDLALAGGDPVRGRKIFRRDSLACRRCHAVDGRGAGLAGPDLSDVGDRLAPRRLLESIVDPGRTIVDGYGTEMVFTRDGRGYQGQVVEESQDTLRLRINDYGRLEVVAIPKVDITERRRGGSAMPSDVSEKLNDRDLRDLIAYLKSLRKR